MVVCPKKDWVVAMIKIASTAQIKTAVTRKKSTSAITALLTTRREIASAAGMLRLVLQRETAWYTSMQVSELN